MCFAVEKRTQIKMHMNLVPQELLSDIFTRLPAKSLGVCNCVCKPWNFLISDPHFIKTHVTKTPVTKFTVISEQPKGIGPAYLYSVHFDNNNPNYDGFAKKLNFKICSGGSRVWGSCNGLILVQGYHGSKYLLNPTTLESKKIPFPRLATGRIVNALSLVGFGFGYDFACDDYAVVALSYYYTSKKDTCVYVYRLKTNQWKGVGAPYDEFSQNCFTGFFLRGSFHWLAKLVNDSSWLIAALSIANEKFSNVPLPGGLSGLNLKSSRLGVLKGCLCLISLVNNRTELWVMKEYGVVESWIKLSIALTDVSHVVSLDLQEDSLVVVEGGRFLLLSSNEKEVTLQDIKVIGLPHDFQVGMTFIESLVSLK